MSHTTHPTHTDIDRVVAANVRAWRARHDIKQIDLAELLGCKQPYVSRIERGRANLTLRAAAKLAHAMSIPVDTLINAG